MPWITGYYKQLVARRQAAYKSNDIAAYRKLRNQSHRRSKRLSKDHYQQNVKQIKSSNPRQWWQSIKQFINQTRLDPTSSLISLANNLCDGDFEALANQINTLFVSISSDLPQLTHTPTITISDISATYSISVADVEKKLASLNINKAIGPESSSIGYSKIVLPFYQVL